MLFIMYTIGQLAKRVGIRPSALRYYEAEGLLQPAERTTAGYRLYDEQAEWRLRFIQRAQRLGFSLRDIQTLLAGVQSDNLPVTEIVEIAEARYLALEHQITDLLILRHELGLFLQDLHRHQTPATSLSAHQIFDQLVDQICSNPTTQATTLLNWLLHQTGCELATHEARDLLRQLRGHHVHIWQEEDAYHILIVDDKPATGKALAALAQLEATCQVHANQQQAPEFLHNDEGYLLIVRGPSAFVFARLFLSLADFAV
ncbi:MAG: MerR family transcriptional regulator [Caldilineaceae bacterium]